MSEIAMPEASMAEIWEVPCLRLKVSEDSIMGFLKRSTHPGSRIHSDHKLTRFECGHR